MAKSSTSFKKGSSGNPGGRPKGPEELKELYYKNGAQAIIYARLMQIIQHGKDPDSVKAADVLMDRVHGRAPVLDENGEVVSDVTFVIEMPKYEEPK